MFCGGIFVEGKVCLRILRERTATVEFERLNDEDIQVTHSITIMKPPYLRLPSMNNPSSPAGSSSTISPCSLTTREPENPWRSNKYNNNVPAAAAKKKSEKSPRAELRSPTVYDWVVLRALLDGWRVNYLAGSSQYSFAIFWVTVSAVVMTRRGSNRNTNLCTESIAELCM